MARNGRSHLPLALAIVLSGCALHQAHVMDGPAQSLAVTTGGPNRSAIFLERVDGGIVLIDLGWWGAEQALEEGLRRMGATTRDVIAVFLTHSHRDHMGAWRSVRHAPFYIAEAELALLSGDREHGGWIPRMADRAVESDLPQPGDVTIRPIRADTFFTFGRDTLRAFLVRGHTAGSAAYLLRGRLFAGDAISKTWWSGFGPARRGYSDDTAEARQSLRSLRLRLEPYAPEQMCTAHLQCSPVTDAFWLDVLGDTGG